MARGTRTRPLELGVGGINRANRVLQLSLQLSAKLHGPQYFSRL